MVSKDLIENTEKSYKQIGNLLIGQKTKVKKCKNKAGKEFEAAFSLKGGDVEFIFKN